MESKINWGGTIRGATYMIELKSSYEDSKELAKKMKETILELEDKKVEPKEIIH